MKLAEFAATEEGKRAIRMSRGTAKILREESIPLGNFAKHYFESSPDVLITQVIGSQSYDAVISDSRKVPSRLKHIEVTQAHEGEDEHLRMLVLENKGSVSLLGPVRKEGTKRKGLKVHVQSEARCHSEILEDQLDRIAAAAERKSEKKYPPDTALVIEFEDHFVFKDAQELAQLEEWGRQKLLPQLTQFQGVYLVASSGNSLVKLSDI